MNLGPFRRSAPPSRGADISRYQLISRTLDDGEPGVDPWGRDPAARRHGGGNRYTNSLIALDAMTGHLAWYRQFVPHDVHDYDVSHVAPVFKTTISGSIRNVVASTGKDGLLRLCHPLRLALFCEYALGSVPTVMV